MKTQAEAIEALKPLSTRQRRTLLMIASGMDLNTIAQKLGTTLGTVNVHRAEAYRKLGIRKAAQAAVLATIAGLVDDWQPVSDERR